MSCAVILAILGIKLAGNLTRRASSVDGIESCEVRSGAGPTFPPG